MRRLQCDCVPSVFPPATLGHLPDNRPIPLDLLLWWSSMLQRDMWGQRAFASFEGFRLGFDSEAYRRWNEVKLFWG